MLNALPCLNSPIPPCCPAPQAVGWVQVRSLVLAASQLLLAVSAALSTPVLAAAALGVASQAGTPAQQASTPLAQLASTACQLAGSTVQLTARGAKLLDAATGGKLLSSAPLAAWARAAAAVQQGGGRLLGMVGMPAPMWGTLGVWRVLLSELTDSWVSHLLGGAGLLGNWHEALRAGR